MRKKIIGKKNESWENVANKINCYLGGTKSNESWRILKSLRQEKNKEIISPITLNKWNEYFKCLLVEDRINYQKKDNTGNNIQISVSLIRITINKKNEYVST